ncbi:MAG: DUF6328 family protein [Ilumatobacteraceae bacterium]
MSHVSGIDAPDDGNLEEERERYRELLEELRVILPGVQVLFAFLLTATFSNRFAELDDLGRNVFAASLLGVSLSAVILMTPAAYHRLAPRLDRAERLGVGIVLTIAGMTLLGLSITGAVFVAARFMMASTAWGLIFSGMTLGTVVGLWFAMPLGQARAVRQRKQLGR